MASGQLGQVLQQLRRMVGGPAADATDRQLLEHYAATGDEAAFTQLVRRHGAMVQGVCRRVLGRDPEADDAFQAAFLVLARKANSVFWQESIGNWLYGVAYRTASKARVRSARRRRLEQEAVGNRSAASVDNSDAHELQQVLDEELIRLPEKFRMPLLLCCLQDQTIDEAAQQLGWSFATVKGRLQRGREMLRHRLERRGIGLSAGVLATILTQGVVNATPPVLLKTTIQTVVTGTLTDSVAALAQGVMQAMFWTKLKTAALILLAVAVLGGGAGTVFYHSGTTTAAPLPEEVKKEPPVRPTASVTKDGLEVVVKPTQAVFAADEKPAFEVTYTNRTEKAFRLHDIGYEVSFFSFVDLKNEGPWQAGPWSYFARPAGRNVQVEPAKAHFQSHTLRGPFTWKGEQRPLDALPPGKYRLTGKIVFGFVRDNNPVPFWSGEVTTNPVEFEITTEKGAQAKPVEKDGLSIAFKPAKTVFAEKEPLEFTVTIKNVSDSPLLLYDLDDLRYFGVHVGDWTPAWMGKAQRKPQAEDSKLLKPGETRDLRLRYEGAVLYHWTGPQRGLQPRNHLDPGMYMVSVSRDFTANPVLGKEIKERQWTGKIASNTVEIEIAAEKPAAVPSVKDANTGITVAVTDDAKALTATDAAGKEIWKLNLIAAAKDFLGTPAIGSVAINAQGQVEARFGKSNLAQIDLKTGKILQLLAR